ncbi:GNAT family N-acetyltransferase [Mesorhizobium amorphae]
MAAGAQMYPDSVYGLSRRTVDVDRIETPRLILRAPVFSDAAIVYELLSDPEISRFSPHSPLGVVADANFVILGWREAAEKGTRTYVGAIRENPREAIGFVHIGPDEELGGLLSPAKSGTGLATEGLEAVISTLRLRNAWTIIDAENAPLIRTLAKVNIRQDRILPAYRIHPHISSEKRDCVLLRQQSS